PIKPSTPDALKALAADGIKVIMLTGDNRTTADAVARKLGITDVEAEVLPDQKIAMVAKLQKAGRIVAMAGDGVNDAPALAVADHCRSRHGAVVGERRRQRIAIARDAPVSHLIRRRRQRSCSATIG